MRNWNTKPSFRRRASYSCCEPTYEELKLQWHSLPRVHARELRAYLWGIETSVTHITFFTKLLLRAYLWGIETAPQCKLKSHRSMLRAYLWGIETRGNQAREGWYESVASLPMRNWNSSTFLTFRDLGRVASLPMRNWNCEQGKMALYQFRLRAYLWGIETAVYGTFESRAYELRAYLWGIETLYCYSPVFRFFVLRAYLWGIETIDKGHTVRMKIWVASLPMRNWNNEGGVLWQGFIFVASLPMRNWNCLKVARKWFILFRIIVWRQGIIILTFWKVLVSNRWDSKDF